MNKLEKSIVIIGAISSGKSTVAKHISDKYKIRIASFGEYLKEYSLHNQLPFDRKNLQDIGDEFIKSQPEDFLLNVINFSGLNSDQLIFEGVRHLIIFDLLKKHSSKMLSIFIDIPYYVRKERYLCRDKSIDSIKSSQEFEIRNSHAVEMEISMLGQLCDLTISSIDDIRLQTSLSNFLDK